MQEQKNESTKMGLFQKIRQIPSNIARDKKNRMLLHSKENEKDRILNENTSFQVRESYKALRTNLIFSLPSTGCKKAIITSALASEGKSTNCLNLAITFAEMNAKVLVVDCDLRRPNLSRLLGVSNSPGLSNYLAGLNSVDDILHESEYQNLSYIVSGSIPPNPIELLSLDRMDTLIEELEKRFDYIFFDTAPINLVSDTVVLSKHAHGVLLVVLQNSTDKESIKYALNQLAFAGTKVIGFVLNGVVYGVKGSYKYKSKKKYYRYSKRYGDYGNHYGGYYGKSRRDLHYKR